MEAIVARSHVTRPGSSNSSQHSPFVDREEAERLARLADAAAEALPILREAVDAIIRATHDEPVRARDEARRLVARVLTDLLRVHQELGQPAPAYRKSAATPLHVVRKRRDSGVVWVAQ